MSSDQQKQLLNVNEKDNLIIVADDIWGAHAHLGSSIKITDTSPGLFMHAGTKLHLTPNVVHLLKEHGNSRSKISNVSISYADRLI